MKALPFEHGWQRGNQKFRQHMGVMGDSDHGCFNINLWSNDYSMIWGTLILGNVHVKANLKLLLMLIKGDNSVIGSMTHVGQCLCSTMQCPFPFWSACSGYNWLYNLLGWSNLEAISELQEKKQIRVSTSCNTSAVLEKNTHRHWKHLVPLAIDKLWTPRTSGLLLKSSEFHEPWITNFIHLVFEETPHP